MCSQYSVLIYFQHAIKVALPMDDRDSFVLHIRKTQLRNVAKTGVRAMAHFRARKRVVLEFSHERAQGVRLAHALEKSDIYTAISFDRNRF